LADLDARHIQRIIDQQIDFIELVVDSI